MHHPVHRVVHRPASIAGVESSVMIAAADQALHEAKSLGRNRAVRATQLGDPAGERRLARNPGEALPGNDPLYQSVPAP